MGPFKPMAAIAFSLAAFVGVSATAEPVETNPYKMRVGEARKKAVEANGGTKESEAAVETGLIWLAKQQKANGSWEFDGTSSEDRIAATGMALLPFLGAGHSPTAEGKYKKIVANGLAYLTMWQLPDGSFKGANNTYLYTHGIAALALVEAYGLTRDAKFESPAQKAISFLTAAQDKGGSWGYRPNTPGDTSILGWQIQALRAAAQTKKLLTAKDTLKKADAFLDTVSTADKDRYGYTNVNQVTPTRTSIGLLCRTTTAQWKSDNDAMKLGVGYLLKNGKPTKDRFDMYYYYYATNLLREVGGERWEKDWNPAMRDLLVERQLGTKEMAKQGSWDPDTAFVGRHCGRLGTTCLALLTLEVYYRHVPLPAAK